MASAAFIVYPRARPGASITLGSNLRTISSEMELHVLLGCATVWLTCVLLESRVVAEHRARACGCSFAMCKCITIVVGLLALLNGELSAAAGRAAFCTPDSAAAAGASCEPLRPGTGRWDGTEAGVRYLGDLTYDYPSVKAPTATGILLAVQAWLLTQSVAGPFARRFLLNDNSVHILRQLQPGVGGAATISAAPPLCRERASAN